MALCPRERCNHFGRFCKPRRFDKIITISQHFFGKIQLLYFNIRTFPNLLFEISKYYVNVKEIHEYLNRFLLPLRVKSRADIETLVIKIDPAKLLLSLPVERNTRNFLMI